MKKSTHVIALLDKKKNIYRIHNISTNDGDKLPVPYMVMAKKYIKL